MGKLSFLFLFYSFCREINEDYIENLKEHGLRHILLPLQTCSYLTIIITILVLPLHPLLQFRAIVAALALLPHLLLLTRLGVATVLPLYLSLSHCVRVPQLLLMLILMLILIHLIVKALLLIILPLDRAWSLPPLTVAISLPLLHQLPQTRLSSAMRT
jgi:hypothetical protein